MNGKQYSARPNKNRPGQKWSTPTHVHVYVCTPTYTPGGLLRKPPLKCAGLMWARFPRRSLTRIRPRMDRRSVGLRVQSYGPCLCGRTYVWAIKDLWAHLHMYAQITWKRFWPKPGCFFPHFLLIFVSFQTGSKWKSSWACIMGAHVVAHVGSVYVR